MEVSSPLDHNLEPNEPVIEDTDAQLAVEDDAENEGEGNSEGLSASEEQASQIDLEEREASPTALSVLEESEVPNPFLVDDSDDSASEEQASVASVDEDEEANDSVPADEIALAQSVAELPPPLTPASALISTEAHPLSSPVLQVNKPIPPTPGATTAVPSSGASSSSDEEHDPPTLYIQGLTVPTMFLPIPNTDALSTLLAKYIPPEQRPRRDVTGDWQRSDYHTLVMTNSWRALARMARDRIVATDPGEVALLLNLWYVRLSSLARLRLYAQTNHEMGNLFSILFPPQLTITPSGTLSTQPSSGSSLVASNTGTSLSSYPSHSSLNLPQTQHRGALSRAEYDYLRDNLLPFELEVLRAKSKYWEGDHMGYLDELRALLGRCKQLARKAGKGSSKGKGSGRDEQAVTMWKERGARICLIMASQLIEMKDFPAATTLLESLLSQSSTVSSPRLRSALARIHLQSGHISAASYHFSQIAQDPTAPRSFKATNAALLAAAEGEWDKVVGVLKEIVDSNGEEEAGTDEKEKYIAANNLAVALLSQGRLKEGIQCLEGALKSSPSTIVSAEPMLFNLSTLYELRSNIVAEKKRELLIEVAKWAGDGLRTTCLKMPST